MTYRPEAKGFKIVVAKTLSELEPGGQGVPLVGRVCSNVFDCEKHYSKSHSARWGLGI